MSRTLAGLLALAVNAAAAGSSTARLAIGPAMHQVRRQDLGCHSDSGYSHQPMGLHAQRLFGESFEQPPVPQGNDPRLYNGPGWRNLSSGQAQAAIDSAPGAGFHGQSSLRLAVWGGGGRAAVANRGLGMEGLHFERARQYEGYLFVRSDGPDEISVAIESWDPDGRTSVLARQRLTFGGSTDWQRLNFSLTPSAGCECVGIVPGSPEAAKANVTCVLNGTYSGKTPAPLSDESAHICVRCGGQFVVEKTSEGVLHVDFAYLSPGDWGRYAGLPVLRRGVEWLQQMGTGLFRMGGSFSGSSFYHWKNWRGDPWTRPSMAAAWGP